MTFQSERTGTRFTYRIRQAEQGALVSTTIHFVAVLTNPDHYEYIGYIRDGLTYIHGKKSAIASDAPSSMAFRWAWDRLAAGEWPPSLLVWHEGRCGKCGRRLTTPESIETGIGPICAGRGST